MLWSTLKPQCLCSVLKIYASPKSWHKNLNLCQILCQLTEKICPILRKNEKTAKYEKFHKPSIYGLLKGFENL